MADYYKILGLAPDADEREIRTSYRKWPKNITPMPEQARLPKDSVRFRDIHDAYELLSDSEKRKEYDRNRREAHQQNAMNSAPKFHHSRSVHLDLRGIIGSRSRPDSEPIRFRSSINDVQERWGRSVE
jgi:curved DNA-binding protein